MTKEELAFKLKMKIEQLPHKYNNVTEQMLYEQGILLGLIVTLANYDSKNLDIVLNQIKKLGVP